MIARIGSYKQSEVSDSHKFLVVVGDSIGSTPWQQTFEFNNEDSDETSVSRIVSPTTPTSDSL